MYKINYLSHNWLVPLLHNREFRRREQQIRGRVVDLGCGTAPYKEEVINLDGEYVGVDWSNSLHDIQPDVVSDLTKPLPFDKGYADTLLSFQVLEHLPTPGDFLKECYRILQPGGALFLTVPFQWRVHEAPYDYFRYTRYGLEYLLKEAGFKEFTIEEMGGFWYTWLLKLNYFTATKFAPGLLKYLFFPWWFFNQVLALLLDRIITSKQEAGGYVIMATK
ncbi:MAG: methyltransferase domain-containing protein [Bacteroidota bacterium]